jgi:hypothetical protein
VKTTLKVIGVMLIVFAASILLTPPLAKILTMFRFEKIFNRLIMVFTIAAAVLAVIRSAASVSKRAGLTLKRGGSGCLVWVFWWAVSWS